MTDDCTEGACQRDPETPDGVESTLKIQKSCRYNQIQKAELNNSIALQCSYSVPEDVGVGGTDVRAVVLSSNRIHSGGGDYSDDGLKEKGPQPKVL